MDTHRRVSAGLLKGLQTRLLQPAYLTLEERATHDAFEPDPTKVAAHMARLLGGVIRGNLLWPSPKRQHECSFRLPHLLTPQEIARVPLLVAVRRLLQPEMRLWFAIWKDGTCAMGAIPQGSYKGPPPWWLLGTLYTYANVGPEAVAHTARLEATKG